MRMLLIIVVLMVMFACQDGMSTRSGFRIDKAEKANHCEGQTSPSPICPNAGTNTNTNDNEKDDENGEENGEENSTDDREAIALLQQYNDGKYGSITVSPLALKKNVEAQLQMTFTAAQDIAQQNTAIKIVVKFPQPTTGFKLSGVAVSPADAEDFFERTPYIFTSSTTNKATAPIMNMAKGKQFTLTFTITPQQDFDFAAQSSHVRPFKNSQGAQPKITVYTGSTPSSSRPPDLIPVYIDKQWRTGLIMRLQPWPHTIKKDTESELTLTFTAKHELKKKGIVNGKQRTHDVHVGASPRRVISTYRVESLIIADQAKATTSFRHGNARNVPSCNANHMIAHSCDIQIVEMAKGDSFTLKLKVVASEDFSITSFTKLADGINTELDDKKPHVNVE